MPTTEKETAGLRVNAEYAGRLAGVLSGFDRLVFRGNLRPLSSAVGRQQYHRERNVLLKDFGTHAETVTNRVKKACLAAAETARFRSSI